MKKLMIKKNRSFDVACLGILVLDIFGSPIDCFPKKGTSEYFDKVEVHPGGCAYNTGVDLAKIGMKTVILGKLGTDVFGDIILEAMKRDNVDVSQIKRSHDESTAVSFVMLPCDGQRRIYHTYGVNASFGFEDICLETITGPAMLHIAGASLMPSLDGKPTVDLLRLAKENGVITSLDPVVKEGIKDLILPCLPYLDIFLPNNDESFYITGLSDPLKQLEFFMKRCPGITGIKLGSEGSIIFDGEKVLRFGVYDVPVIDTCGAGDAFIAGFLYGIHEGWNIEITAKFATAAASLCVGSVGATTAISHAGKILEFVREHELEEYCICQL